MGTPPHVVIARLRAEALVILAAGRASPASLIRLAWRFLKQHGARG